MYLACNDVGPLCDPCAACHTGVSERSGLLQWIQGRPHNPALKHSPANSPTVTIHCRAHHDTTFTKVDSISMRSDNPVQVECGKEYQIQFRYGHVLRSVLVATPEDGSEWL